MLKNIDNVEKCHDFFVDNLPQTLTNDKAKVPTSKNTLRITMVLDAYSDKSCENWMNISEVNHYISLQEYMIRHKLSEREALAIFYEIVKVVEKIHAMNVCHRDLKIQNFLINYHTRKIMLTNFCLGVVCTDSQLLLDQRGSPAYISPELLQGNGYNGKASDVWTLGVIFFILCYQNFPFIESTTAALFKKICQCEFTFPTEGGVRISEDTKKLIKNHLLTTTDRFTATETREYLERQFEKIQRTTNITSRAFTRDDQIVPDIDCESESPSKIICQDTPSPKYELSTENISHALKMMSNQESSNNKMFLRPSLLAERSNRISVSPSGPSGVTRNLTRQINQLSVRNNQHQANANLSWHNRITNSLYEIRFRPVTTERARMQQRSVQGNASSPGSTSVNNAGYEAIYSALNELFSSGNFPSNGIVHNFNGVINQEIAFKLSVWLRTNFHDNPLIREIYLQSSHSPHSPGDDIGKFIEFLRRCNVEMEVINGQVYVKSQQSNQILIFLTFLLQLAGYNNNYFLNISRSP